MVTMPFHLPSFSAVTSYLGKLSIFAETSLVVLPSILTPQSFYLRPGGGLDVVFLFVVVIPLPLPKSFVQPVGFHTIPCIHFLDLSEDRRSRSVQNSRKHPLTWTNDGHPRTAALAADFPSLCVLVAIDLMELSDQYPSLRKFCHFRKLSRRPRAPPGRGLVFVFTEK